MAGLLVVGSLAGIVMNVAIALPAVFLGRAIDAVLAYQRHTASAGRVAEAAELFIAVTAATQVPRIGKRWWLGLARTRLQANVRADALRGVLDWPMEQLAATSVGGVMARVIGDVQVLGLGVGEVIVETWDTLLFSVSLIVTMFFYSPHLALIALAPVPLALWLAKVAGRAVARRTTAARQADAELTTVLHEQLGGFKLLRLTGRAGLAARRVAAMADRQAVAELDAIRLEAALAAAYTFLLSAGVVFVVWLGGREVAAGALSVGGLVAFLQLFVRFVGRAPRIPQMANRVQAAGAAYVRLEPLLAPPPPIAAEPSWSSLRAAHVAGVDAPTVPPPSPRRGASRLVFQDVTFTFPGGSRPAIADLALEVPAGSLVAVTGPVGAGKSALARLAAGIYAPDAGQVLLDGEDVSRLAAAERARRVGYLGQEPQLFSGSIVDNIVLAADPASPDRPGGAVRQAVSLALLEPDLDAMAEGLATEVGELGMRVSGGQRQRIALARALAAAGAVPGLLVLDDPFSAVDVQTEAAIVSGLRTILDRRAGGSSLTTILLISHRLAAFAQADLVVVLDSGRVAEVGSHAQLLAAGGLYARIYRAWRAADHVSEPPTVNDRAPRR